MNIRVSVCVGGGGCARGGVCVGVCLLFTQLYSLRTGETKQQKDVGAMCWWDRHLFSDQWSWIH